MGELKGVFDETKARNKGYKYGLTQVAAVFTNQNTSVMLGHYIKTVTVRKESITTHLCVQIVSLTPSLSLYLGHLVL